MNEQQKHDQLMAAIGEVKADVNVVKENLNVVKTDVAVMQNDMSHVKEDVAMHYQKDEELAKSVTGLSVMTVRMAAHQRWLIGIMLLFLGALAGDWLDVLPKVRSAAAVVTASP